MTSRNWQIAASRQPRPEEWAFDVTAALETVVGVRSLVPDDAFTAATLGVERVGHGVLIRESLVLTIGYLLTEAEDIWLTLNDGRVVPGHALAYDQETGFGLVQALARLDMPTLPLGTSDTAQPGTRVIVGGHGGRQHALAAIVIGRQEFAGYWEYLLEDAIFTAPAHPFWGGTALIGPTGELLGIGSLQIEQQGEAGPARQANMMVPVDLLKPILQDMVSTGRANRPPRPWLGLFAAEVEGLVAVAGLAPTGPADQAGLQAGDLIRAVAGADVSSLADLYRRMWSLGEAGVEVPLSIDRGGQRLDLRVASSDRSRFLKPPRLHS